MILKQVTIGVVCEDMVDFHRWVSNQSYNTLKRYFAITNVNQATIKYDELVITTTAQCNSNFYDIYKKLNGAYRLSKKESVDYSS